MLARSSYPAVCAPAPPPRPRPRAQLLRTYLSSRQRYIGQCLEAAAAGGPDADLDTLTVILGDVLVLVYRVVAQAGELFLQLPGVTAAPLLVKVRGVGLGSGRGASGRGAHCPAVVLLHRAELQKSTQQHWPKRHTTPLNTQVLEADDLGLADLAFDPHPDSKSELAAWKVSPCRPQCFLNGAVCAPPPPHRLCACCCTLGRFTARLLTVVAAPAEPAPQAVQQGVRERLAALPPADVAAQCGAWLEALSAQFKALGGKLLGRWAVIAGHRAAQ